MPCHDDRSLFEMLILEGAQAGLSWLNDLGQTRELSARFCFLRPTRDCAIYRKGCASPAC